MTLRLDILSLILPSFVLLAGCTRNAPSVPTTNSSDEAPVAEVALVEEPATLAGELVDEEEHVEIAPIAWPSKVSRTQLETGVRRAVEYLARTTDDEGRFAYIVNLDPQVPPVTHYDVVRHAGTMYGLGMYLERYQGATDTEIKDALIRQGKFLRQQFAPVPGQKNMLAIWADPKVTGRDHPLHAPLGSTGLGLMGLTSLERVAPGNVPLAEMQSLARFILFMQRDDGSFYRSYAPDHGGKILAEPLLFYPGESALGLLLLYEIDGDERWLNAAAQAVAHMATRREATGEPLLDHWMLIAAGRLWPHFDKIKDPPTRETITQFAADLCERFLDSIPPPTDNAEIAGCMTRDGMTCPTATRTEGLASALAVIPREEVALRSRIERATEDALLFLLRSQVAEGQYRGGIPYAIARLPDDDRRAATFNPLSGEIRIDYVFHAISAMMLYDDVKLKPDSQPTSAKPSSVPAN